MRNTLQTRQSLIVATLLVVALSPAIAGAQNLTVYDDALRNGFEDWGWAANRNFADTSQRHGDTASLSFSSNSTWEGVLLHGPVDGSSYDAILLWVRGSAAGLRYNVSLSDISGGAFLGNFIPGGVIPNESWALATIPFSSLGLTGGGGASGIVVQAEGAQGTIYLDDITLRALPPVPLTVSLDPNGARRAINPLIYGVSHFDEPGDSQIAYPGRRWGGNATTRYNWEIDIQNRASDYFFINYPNNVANPALLPNGSEADRWIDSTKSHGGEPVLTIPIIGWTPKGSNPLTDRVPTWGYSIAKYGPQQHNEGEYGGHADAGNGCTPSSPEGTCTFLPVTTDPTDTSKPVTPAYFVSWLSHIISRVGTAASGGVKYIILDNEPMLWNFTHHDIHPNPVTYDELWQKTLDSALAFKRKDPGVKIIGPALWGWCAYWSSASDGQCSGNAGADYTSHGNRHFTPWYLQQVADYQALHGIRLVDYLDWHYYPQASNVFSRDESAATAALRLRSLKSLYDPTYVDESWISGVPVNTVNLIPRMRNWIAQYAPGMKIAINEYSFGYGDGATWDDGNGVSSALAQAEALAIFGREGVDMANRWTVPPANSRMEQAFKLYLDYDGAGAKVEGEALTGVASSNVNQVGAYAVRGTDKLYILLFNKDTNSRDLTVNIAGGMTATANLYRFSSAPLAAAGAANITSGTLVLNLPARSATLAVAPLAAPGLRLYTLPPCRLVDTRNPTGTLGGPALAGSVTRTFPLAGICGVPASARAVSLNVTVTGSATAGDLKLFAGGLPTPTATTIHFSAGRTRANNAVLGVSADGTAALTAEPELALGATTHFILDVNGYLE
jgi:Glycoside hydrolase family 44